MRLSARKLLATALLVVGLYGIVDWVMTPDRHLPWQSDEAAAFALAADEGKGVMVDFAADWCAPCKEFENFTFADPGVYDRIVAGYVPLKFDVSKGTAADEAAQEKYDAGTLPAVIFLDAEGRELARASEYMPADAFLGVIDAADDALASGTAGGGAVDRFAEALDQGWIWAYLLAFAFGFLTSLTPCVYPMIPITVAVFGAKGEAVSRRKAFALASCYVLGMGLLYAALGTGFALAGGRAGTLLANPWVVVPIAVLLVALAASLFGAFEIRLPMAMQQRLNQVGGQGYGGAFGMGLVGGLVAAPCTGPFLAGMLGFVATTGNWIAGSTLLFTYALGVGVLFLAIALTSMSLPRSGAWMETIKNIGGVALVVVALYFLRPVAPVLGELTEPTVPHLLGWIGMVVCGVALGALHRPFRVPAA